MNRPAVVVVHPSSSGVSLSSAIEELGGIAVHLWQSSHKDAWEQDPHPHKVLNTDGTETLRALRELAPVAVCPGSEFAVTLANDWSATLGLSHNDPKRTLARRDKQEMLTAVAAAGLATPWSRTLAGPDDVDALLAGLDDFPIVVKPAGSAGSDGCAMCHNADDVHAAYQAVAGQVNLLGSTNTHILAQEFLSGPQYIVNTVSRGGRHLLADVYLYRIDEVAGKPLIRDAVVRTALTEAEQQAVEYTLDCLDALGIREGAAHSEVRITGRGPRLIEVNSRLMGPVLPADVYVPALGFSHATLLAQSVLRPESFHQQLGRPYRPARAFGLVLLRTYRTGRIQAMNGLDAIRRIRGFHSFARLPRAGQRVSPENLVTNGTTGLAYFVDDDPHIVAMALEETHALEDAESIFTIS